MRNIIQIVALRGAGKPYFINSFKKINPHIGVLEYENELNALSDQGCSKTQSEKTILAKIERIGSPVVVAAHTVRKTKIKTDHHVTKGLIDHTALFIHLAADAGVIYANTCDDSKASDIYSEKDLEIQQMLSILEVTKMATRASIPILILNSNALSSADIAVKMLSAIKRDNADG